MNCHAPSVHEIWIEYHHFFLLFMSHSFFDNVCSHWYFGFIFFFSLGWTLSTWLWKILWSFWDFFLFGEYLRMRQYDDLFAFWRTESISLVLVQQGSICWTLYVRVVFRWNTFLNDLKTQLSSSIFKIKLKHIQSFGNRFLFPFCVPSFL